MESSPFSSSSSSSSAASSTIPVSTSSPTSHQQYDEEVILKVPHEFMEFPLGFVVDSGGSVAKLLYRSKEDYNNGKLIKQSDHGLLHMRHFKMTDIWQIHKFIKCNCDVIPNKNNSEVTWWMTGVTVQHFRTNLEKEFNIKIKLHFENGALQSLIQMMKQLNIGFYECDSDAVSSAAQYIRLMTQTIRKWKHMGDNSLELYDQGVKTDKEPNNNDNAEESSKLSKLENPVMDLIAASDVHEWIGKYMNNDECCIKTPSMLVLYGSSIGILLVDDKMNLKMADYMGYAGKTLCGLVEEMLGENDFDKFMEMAEKGNSDNVDCLISDLKNYENKEEDWYSLFPDSATVFELGKLTSENTKGKGTYSKEDLAAGLLSLQAKILSKLVILHCRVHKMDTAYFSGSILKYRIVRRMIQKHFLVDSLLLTLEGIPLIKIHFLQHPGFLVGLGVWAANVEKTKSF